eukprot:CAMPEP_0201481032 /NCGR_PEP_ID=MMETSP0151_2-20130828/5369_1 /ASSEMBLY_ACC=CAM_ASM_000257 /TAXON_ID=200890 /ORGANISM="Paramoeba atlantica, Strain 621/1 / CCAP 1560/9" /LENGTH=141 /DNA_ID=CAMNT_0047863053 /DNA_START=59 /DNA_END=484 /DNA_ORIENTATION=-
MANCDDPSLVEAYESLRGKDVNWVCIGYGQGNKLVVQAKGNDGAAGLQGALDDKQCQYGMVKVKYVADEDSELGFTDSVREKYAFFTFAGENASALKRGKISVHKADLKKIYREFAIEIQASEKSELSEENILGLIKRVNY